MHSRRFCFSLGEQPLITAVEHLTVSRPMVFANLQLTVLEALGRWLLSHMAVDESFFYVAFTLFAYLDA